MRKNVINKKGFTLIELLAVIVVLGIIMVFAIPAVLDKLNDTRKKTLQLFTERVAVKALEKAQADQLLGTDTATTSSIYDLKTDLKFTDTGNYVGCATMNKDSNDPGDTSDFTITVYLTDGRFCTPSTGITSAAASSFTVQETDCPTTAAAFTACGS